MGHCVARGGVQTAEGLKQGSRLERGAERPSEKSQYTHNEQRRRKQMPQTVYHAWIAGS